MEDKFELLKDFGEHGAGRVFDSYYGRISVVHSEKLHESISFDDVEYFISITDDKFLKLGGDEEG